MLFVLPAENADDVEHLYKKVAELKELDTIKVKIVWKLISKRDVFTVEDYKNLLPQT